MIQSLSITNIALIEKLNIRFHGGLHVLSGETGAGKSIVVDAVNLILGGRAEKDLIRTGTDKATAEAEFDVPEQKKVAELLERESIEYDGRTVTVYREISRTGKNVCRVCGVMIPLSFLRELAPCLMDIHGQHDHRFLLDPAMHLSYLDRMGGPEHQRLLADTREACRSFLANHRTYARMVKKNENRENRMSLLEAELETLRKAKPRAGEAEELTLECQRLRASEKSAAALRTAYESLAEGQEEISAMGRARDAMNALLTLHAEDPDLEALAERSKTLYYEMEELAFDLHRELEKRGNEEGRLEQAEHRLDLLKRLIRRYGSEEEALRAEKTLEAEYAEWCALEDQIGKTAAEHKRLLSVYRKAARALSASRMELAGTFEAQMSRELSELGMGSTRFEASFAEIEGRKPQMPRETGDDEMEFLISPNPGEPLKPLARIASGGELSRLMLALKTIEAGRAGLDAMVFDEIDTGISGRMAQVVAEKLIAISRYCQVICVTHLPQIAAAAEHEYLVQKQVSGERTRTTVTELDREGRREEVARMISGAEGITEASRDYAEKMIAAAERQRTDSPAPSGKKGSGT